MAFEDVIPEGFVGSGWWVSLCKARSWGTDLPKCSTENWRCPSALVTACPPQDVSALLFLWQVTSSEAFSWACPSHLCYLSYRSIAVLL